MTRGERDGTVSRRRFLLAGGLAAGQLVLAGRSGSRPAVRRPGAGHGARSDPASPIEIRMRSASGGADVWFAPAGLRVEPGTTVRWIAESGVHTATAYHPANGDRPLRMPDYAEPWDSGYLSVEDDGYEHTFPREGVYDYFCRPHEAAGMVGRIVVARADRTSHLELPGWDGGAREEELAPPSARTAEEPGLPRAARTSFPSVTRVLDEGRVPADGARTPSPADLTAAASRSSSP